MSGTVSHPGSPEQVTRAFEHDMRRLESERSRLDRSLQATQDAFDEARHSLAGIMEEDRYCIDASSPLARRMGEELQEALASNNRACNNDIEELEKQIRENRRHMALRTERYEKDLARALRSAHERGRGQ